MRHFTLFKITLLLLIIWAALIIPISVLLPISTSFENNVFENAQVIVLLGGNALCVYFSHQALHSFFPPHKLWLSAAGIFLILAFRELSWSESFLSRATLISENQSLLPLRKCRIEFPFMLLLVFSPLSVFIIL